MGRQQYGSGNGSLGRPRPPVRTSRRQPVPEYRSVRESVLAPGWLLLELPTAVLLAVFVGTGWLGYAQHSGTPAQPRPAVVVPADHPIRGR
ncbi:MAG: hypothetical protein JWN03_3447 [Nocardia sp.]|uniref:hypothetical protein n=1 Tax=Nocardia sp. TaxID=1821 RepID=UPI0026129618|nr:hypothetical protein [Nocardia sp.]MCU1643172.1 hypothetical protein [Nocardia sp.]